MFVIRKEFTYERRIDVKVPSPKRVGHFDTESFFVKFKSLPVDQQTAIASKYGNLSGNQASDYTAELMHEVVVDWRDLVDEDKAPVEFSSDTLDDMLQVPFVRVALMQAYLDSISGTAVKARSTGN